MRILIQITHYYLLVLLHLPSAVHMREDVDGYSRVTCIDSSRELLSRYIRLRCMKHPPFCCRAIDLCAFTASLALLLAHITSLNLQQFGSCDALAHQRLSDRATVEETIDIMLQIGEADSDLLLQHSVTILKCLAVMEEDATKKSRSNPTILADNIDSPSPKRAIRTRIPFFGIVYITSDGVSADPLGITSKNRGLPPASFEWREGMDMPISPSVFMAHCGEGPVLSGLI